MLKKIGKLFFKKKWLGPGIKRLGTQKTDILKKLPLIKIDPEKPLT